MDSQLEAVRQEVCEVKGKIAKTELKLAEHAHNVGKEKSFDLLLSLNRRLSGLQEEENIILLSQAASEPCPGLVHMSLSVFTSFRALVSFAHPVACL